MTDRIPGIDFPQLVAEGIMVVVSILVAFALDAWWEERQLAQEVLEDLYIVEAELEENIRLVNQSIGMMERVARGNALLIDEMKANPQASHVTLAGDQVFWALFFNPTLDPSMGAIDAWIATGRLAGVNNPELRKRLASVRGKVTDVTEEQLMARMMGARDLWPLLRGEIDDIGPIYEIFAGGYHGRPNTGINEIPNLPQMSVPNTRQILFTMQGRMLWYGASIVEMTDFKAELEGILALLEAEIGHKD